MSLKIMLKFWEDIRNKKDLFHIMLTLKGQFKFDNREKWNMLLLLYTTELGIEVRKWLGILLEVLV